jgi:hypothetical protein
MKKGRVFQKGSTLSGNSYYEKEEGRPYSFVAQLVYKFLIAYTGGNTKEIRNLNSAFEKADSPPPPPPAQKRESTRKKLVSLLPILQNCVYECS